MAKARCKEKTKAGKRCKSPPLKGKDYCLSHAPADTRDSVGFVAANGKGGRPKLPTPTEIARDLIEKNIEIVLRPHFRVLGYDVEATKDGLALVPLEGGGAKLYGESREGVVTASEYEDLGAHMAAADKLLDRIYGRPKQATEITGADGGPVTFADLAASVGG
jgi:hypothetical protein